MPGFRTTPDAERWQARRTHASAVLLPAAMKLLGDWNWYLPRWLEWLPKLNVEPEIREADVHEIGPEAPSAVLD
jgi:uncharacterized membrane protein YdfJ with MMPL/SSD domain